MLDEIASDADGIGDERHLGAVLGRQLGTGRNVDGLVQPVTLLLDVLMSLK